MNVVRLHRDPRKHEYEAGKLTKRLRRQAGQAIVDFNGIAVQCETNFSAALPLGIAHLQPQHLTVRRRTHDMPIQIAHGDHGLP